MPSALTNWRNFRKHEHHDVFKIRPKAYRVENVQLLENSSNHWATRDPYDPDPRLDNSALPVVLNVPTYDLSQRKSTVIDDKTCLSNRLVPMGLASFVAACVSGASETLETYRKPLVTHTTNQK